MAAVRSKNTKPEMQVRSLLHRMGYRFRIDVRKLPGRPDIVLPKYRLAIFIHGCFWHGHRCQRLRIPKTRADFWASKIQGNRNRDAKAIRALRAAGWRVKIIWQCRIKDLTEAGWHRLVRGKGNK